MHHLLPESPVPNKRTARAVHDEIRAKATSSYELGILYRGFLRQRLWRTQRELAKDLHVSSPKVSRCIALAGVPHEVVDALGGPGNLSFRIGELLLGALNAHGEESIVARAREAKRIGYTRVDEFIEYVVADRIPEQNVEKVRIRLGRDKKSLRVEVPGLARLIPHLPRLEDWLARSIMLFEAANLSEVSVAAHVARDARSKP